MLYMLCFFSKIIDLTICQSQNYDMRIMGRPAGFVILYDACLEQNIVFKLHSSQVKSSQLSLRLDEFIFRGF